MDKLFRWHPDMDEFTQPLQARKPFKLLYERLPTGIDNHRIDVVLSQEFMDRCRLYVRRAMLHEVMENHWENLPHPPIARIYRRSARLCRCNGADR